MTTPPPRDNSGDFEDAAELARIRDEWAENHISGRCGCSSRVRCNYFINSHQRAANEFRRLAARGEHPPKF